MIHTKKHYSQSTSKSLLIILCLTIFFISDLSAQTSSYILHTIKEGETLSAIAKANKTTVGDIMRMNGMNSKSRLINGAIIKIPTPDSTETPATSTPNTPVVMDKNLGIPAKPTVAVPDKKVATPIPPKVEPLSNTSTNSIKYTIVKGDNLYKLSKQFKLTEAQLMQMNDMKDDHVKLGQVLIINLPQAPTSKPITIDTIKTNKAVLSDKLPTKAAMPAPITPIKKDSIAVVKSIVAKVAPPKVETMTQKDTVLTVAPKLLDTLSHYIVKKDSVIVVKLDSTTLTKKESTPTLPSIKDTLATIAKAKPIELLPEPKPINKNTKYVNDEGYFAAFFNRKAISDNPASGDAGAFKTASGWEDKKYYILINGLLPGTIVRVTANNKSICAKVLTGLPEVKEDNGYLARLNNAAVAALGIETNKFAVTVNHE